MGALTGRHGRSSRGPLLALLAESQSHTLLSCTAQPGTHRRGHLYMATAPDEAKPVRPPSSPSQREACRRLEYGAATTTAEDMHDAAVVTQRWGLQWRSEADAAARASSGQKVARHRATANTEPSTRSILCVVYIKPYTHTRPRARMHGSPKTRDKKNTGLQLALPPQHCCTTLFSLQSSYSLHSSPFLPAK